MRTFEELLDEYEYSLKIEVPGINDSWFNKIEQKPVFNIGDSWGTDEGAVLGLDLKEIA